MYVLVRYAIAGLHCLPSWDCGSHSLQTLYGQNCFCFCLFILINGCRCYGRPIEYGKPLYFFLWFLSFFLFSSPNLNGRKLDVYHTSTHDVALVQIRMQVWNVLHAARWKCRTQKFAIWMRTIAQLCRAVFSQLRHILLWVVCVCAENRLCLG